MTGMASSHRMTGSPRIILLPFLDIIFSTIGIIVVFLAQFIIRQERPQFLHETDHLIICSEIDHATLYLSRTLPAIDISSTEFADIIPQISDTTTGVTNLVFAFDEDCLQLRNVFHTHYREAIRIAESEESTGPTTLFRLRDWPLGSHPSAATELENRWKGASESVVP